MPSLKELSKSSEKFTLRQAITLEELFALMEKNLDPAFANKFKLKKGLFGKSIAFEVYMTILPKISIKNNIVTVRKVSSSTQVGVGGLPSVDLKASKQTTEAVKSGGLSKAATGGSEYFLAICDAMRNLLKDLAE